MASPENTFLWFEDTEHYIKRRVSLVEFAAMVAEVLASKRDTDKHASSKATVKERAASSESKK